MLQSELYAKHPQPLVTLLSLDGHDKFPQDWEYCVSDKDRIKEFIGFYKSMPLNDRDKMSLMMIIIDSYNSSVWDHGFNNDIWETISSLIKNELLFFKEEIIYWSSMDYNDCEIDDAWAIAKNMRVLLRILHKNDYLNEDDTENWCDDAKKGIFG